MTHKKAYLLVLVVPLHETALIVFQCQFECGSSERVTFLSVTLVQRRGSGMLLILLRKVRLSVLEGGTDCSPFLGKSHTESGSWGWSAPHPGCSGITLHKMLARRSIEDSLWPERLSHCAHPRALLSLYAGRSAHWWRGNKKNTHRSTVMHHQPMGTCHSSARGESPLDLPDIFRY